MADLTAYLKRLGNEPEPGVSDTAVRIGVVLDVRRPYAEDPRGAIGLEVDPPDQAVAEQERQHVVAVHPLLLGHVDLDPVVEAEQVLGPRPLPDHGVEGAQQRAGVHLARQPGVLVEVRRPAPSLDPHGQQLAGLHEGVDRRPGGGVVLDPQNGYLHTCLGALYMQKGFNDAAIIEFAYALRQDPQDVAAATVVPGDGGRYASPCHRPAGLDRHDRPGAGAQAALARATPCGLAPAAQRGRRPDRDAVRP